MRRRLIESSVTVHFDTLLRRRKHYCSYVQSMYGVDSYTYLSTYTLPNASHKHALMNMMYMHVVSSAIIPICPPHLLPTYYLHTYAFTTYYQARSAW